MAHRIIKSSWCTELAICEFGSAHSTAGQQQFPANRDRYYLCFVLEGKGSLQCSQQYFRISESDIFIISPSEKRNMQWDVESPYAYIWISFTCEHIADFLKEPVIRQAPVQQLWHQIYDYLNTPDSDGKLISLTYDLLWQLDRIPQHLSAKAQRYTVFAKSYIEANFMSQIKIQHLAEQLHIDRRYLTTLFRREYGMPPQNYLITVRLNKARDYLRAGYSATEAAQMAGFADLPNFFRQYRAKFGVTPSSERNNQAKFSP